MVRARLAKVAHEIGLEHHRVAGTNDPAKWIPACRVKLRRVEIKQPQCAAHGLEPRLPFLDHRLVEFMFRVPGRLKIREFITGAVNPNSGKPRILIVVDAPGERLKTPVPKRGHRGTRYTEGEDWPR
ncbi:MAG: hypothetical protein IH811_09435 [Proteobacteria bacterium]|nr:hypothetical protein [Pseudomonadota bacterium]